jgi:4,5-DOPA dioxygenase extradiol
MPDESDSGHAAVHSSARMPALFVGHGSPMNAITDSASSRCLRALRARLPGPKGILVVSAHWMTKGTRVTCTRRNNQLYDFAGFPEELSNVAYHPPGDISLAHRIREMLGSNTETDAFRPLDHGCWTVLCRLYPEAVTPVLQLSIDAAAAPKAHVDLATKLRPLRSQGIMLLASGNIVHALGALQHDIDAEPPHWVTEFDEVVAHAVENNDIEALCDWHRFPYAERAVPEPSHYLPFLYFAGLREKDDVLSWICTGMEHGSISMRSAVFGNEALPLSIDNKN